MSMLLNIWRYVVVTVQGKVPPLGEIRSDEVVVRPAKSGGIVWEEGNSFLLEAHSPYNATLPVNGNQVVVPADVHKPLHAAIECYVNLLAVQMRSNRWIASPALYAAIEPVDEPARAWIGAYQHMKREVPQRPLRIWPRVEPHRHLPLLLDRLDG
jgi:hypothetical protein